MSDINIGKDVAGSTIIDGNENKIETHHHHHYPPVPPSQEQLPDTLKVDLSSLPPTSSDLFGRSRELELLNSFWNNPKTNIAVLVAWGGVGKTALVNKWLNLMAQDDFRRADRVFGWSFYDQGAVEGKQTSADRLIDHLLRWFGDPNPNEGDFIAKSKRLSELISKQKTLLILDGLEPLQYPPGHDEGRLKDSGLKVLLRNLAVRNSGLCIITTRLWTDDLKSSLGTSVEKIGLSHLAPEDGAALLKHLGVDGTENELKNASVEFEGHALALTLLGTYLSTVCGGDVRQKDKIECLMIEENMHGRHARRIMESYEKWMRTTDKGRRELNILRMMGLFDRPAESGVINALMAKPKIKGLTDELMNISQVQWQFALKNLRDLRLLLEKDKNRPDVLDCHPLVREHFGDKLSKENPEAWKEAHSRLYEYYRNIPTKQYPDTLEEMEPLFAAVAHGCKAGRHQEAMDVYYERISRGEEGYIMPKLGACGADLSAISNFFEIPWTTPAHGLSDFWKAEFLNRAGFDLRTLGRLKEAIQSMRLSMEINIKREDWKRAAIDALNLSEFSIADGNIPMALSYAKRCIELAVQGKDWIWQREGQSVLADALHHAGEFTEAERLFQGTEAFQKEKEPEYFYLYSFSGVQYCDLLLSQGKYQDVFERTFKRQEWKDKYFGLIDAAIEYLDLGRAFLLQAQEEKTNDLAQAEKYLNQAAEEFVKAGYQDYLARGLLARAALYRLKREFPKAHADLEEAYEIADRSEMKLYLTDYHLESSRLCIAEGKTGQAAQHLESAKKLIAETGYHRRDKEAEELGRCLNQDSQD